MQTPACQLSSVSMKNSACENLLHITALLVLLGAAVPVMGQAYITPGSLPAADVLVTIDSHSPTPISPYIYGVNGKSSRTGWDFTNLPSQATPSRLGGNRWSGWNWENGWSNAGSDASFSNDQWITTITTAGGAVKAEIDNSFKDNTAVLLTAPVIGYSSAPHGGNAPLPAAINDTTPAVPSLVWFFPNTPKNPAGPTATPNQTDQHVYTDDFIKWCQTTYPGHDVDPNAAFLFQLDNEVDGWGGCSWSKHAEIRGFTSSGASVMTGYQEIPAKDSAYAAAIKDVMPQAKVVGLCSAGWEGLGNLGRCGNFPLLGTNGYTWYVDFWMDRLHQSEVLQGRKLVDALDFHWYPHAAPAGQSASIIDYSTTENSNMIDARMQATRSMWDTTYMENSGYTGNHQPIMAFRRIKNSAARYNPGTGISITEYCWGREGDISGCIAQADFFGICAREGVMVATYWSNVSVDEAGYNGDFNTASAGVFAAFRTFLAYDGANGRFGGLFVPTAITDANRPADPNRPSYAANQTLERVTAYTSMDAGNPNRMTIIAINKSQTVALNTGFQVTHNAQFSTAEVYRITGANGTAPSITGPARQADITLTATNAFTASLPSQSITIFVLKNSTAVRTGGHAGQLPRPISTGNVTWYDLRGNRIVPAGNGVSRAPARGAYIADWRSNGGTSVRRIIAK